MSYLFLLVKTPFADTSLIHWGPGAANEERLGERTTTTYVARKPYSLAKVSWTLRKVRPS
jgi:hypothetical protein